MDNYVDKVIVDCFYKTYNVCRSISDRNLTDIVKDFRTYETYIKQWSRRQNLVSKTDVDNLWKKHFLPSLKPLEVLSIPENSECLDAGSGAGFPGLPLKLFRPDLHLSLLDSNRKKILFLKQVSEKMKLDRVKYLNCRLKDVENKFDYIFSRAMGPPETLLSLFAERLTAGGKVVIWTAKNYELKLPGCQIEEHEIDHGGKLMIIN